MDQKVPVEEFPFGIRLIQCTLVLTVYKTTLGWKENRAVYVRRMTIVNNEYLHVMLKFLQVSVESLLTMMPCVSRNAICKTVCCHVFLFHLKFAHGSSCRGIQSISKLCVLSIQKSDQMYCTR